MEISALNSLQRPIDASQISPERLAGNSHLTEEQKIAEASRQFEAILLKQILDSSQKTVIHSKLSDNSTSSSIYHDMISNQLADSISKSGAFGLARTFQHQLSHEDRAEIARQHNTNAGKALAPHSSVSTQVHSDLRNGRGITFKPLKLPPSVP